VSGRYWTFTLVGLLVAGASIVAIDWGLYHLVRTGTCASGGPYVSARPCPPGTGTHIFALVAGVFAGLIGIGIYAARGKGGRPSPIGLPGIMWALLFITLALATIVAAFGPANNDDDGARTAAVVLGVVFIPMGLAPLPIGIFRRRREQRFRRLVEHGKRCIGEVIAVSGTGVRINDNPVVKMTIRAEPPGETPFTIDKTSTVSEYSPPRVGDHCVVFYDPADPHNRNGVTFDPVPGMDVPPPRYAQPAQQPAAAEEDDPLAQIEKLGELRERGLITQEEFDEQKRRLLGEL
jgi:hypothetical protein